MFMILYICRAKVITCTTSNLYEILTCAWHVQILSHLIAQIENEIDLQTYNNMIWPFQLIQLIYGELSLANYFKFLELQSCDIIIKFLLEHSSLTMPLCLQLTASSCAISFSRYIKKLLVSYLHYRCHILRLLCATC